VALGNLAHARIVVQPPETVKPPALATQRGGGSRRSTLLAVSTVIRKMDAPGACRLRVPGIRAMGQSKRGARPDVEDVEAAGEK
jgi:hypothetical protein